MLRDLSIKMVFVWNADADMIIALEIFSRVEQETALLARHLIYKVVCERK